MWKLALGFVVFVALAIFMLSKSGNVDMGGEKHGAEGMQTESAAPAK